MAALGPEVSRADPATRREVTRGIKDIAEWLSGLILDSSKRRAREKAVATYAMIIGAVMLARAVDEPELSEELLKAAQASILAAMHPPPGRHTRDRSVGQGGDSGALGSKWRR